jgi:pyruvate/2-oxoglutarate dehydrogenase complex dihydrolipoamide dehydrogenase (E3) component
MEARRGCDEDGPADLSGELIRPGDVVATARRVPGAADAVTGSIDASAAFGQRDYMTGNWDDAGQQTRLESKRIELMRGTGRLTGERVVEVGTPAGTRRRLAASRAVLLATGTTSVVPPVEGPHEVRPWDNRAITSAKELPGRLLVLGGGAIGAEMAQGFRRLGSDEVTVIEGATARPRGAVRR